MLTLALLSTALLFGGMMLYSFGFAAVLFAALPPDTAGATIRRTFPHFYHFVLGCAALGAALVWPHDTLAAILLAVIAITTIPNRQILMPAINRATDTGAKTRFKWLHGASVLVTLAHIGLAGVALARFLPGTATLRGRVELGKGRAVLQ
jgi:hypothetical protein